MTLDVQILGGGAIKALAAQIEASGNKGLGREMGAALRKTTDPVERSIRSEYEGLPQRGGYAGVFSKSLRFRRSLRTGGRTASLTLTTFADGTRERRDIRKLEDGVLRHPVYGRSRRTARGRSANPWASTRVKGGFHKRGTDSAMDVAYGEMIKVRNEYAAKLIK